MCTCTGYNAKLKRRKKRCDFQQARERKYCGTIIHFHLPDMSRGRARLLPSFQLKVENDVGKDRTTPAAKAGTVQGEIAVKTIERLGDGAISARRVVLQE